MDINKLTQKSQEALAEAQSIATRMGHIEVDGEHLLMALIDQPEGLVPRLLDQTGADTAALRADLERELNRRPKVSGRAPRRARSLSPGGWRTCWRPPSGKPSGSRTNTCRWSTSSSPSLKRVRRVPPDGFFMAFMAIWKIRSSAR